MTPGPSVNIEDIHNFGPWSAGPSCTGYYVGRVTRIVRSLSLKGLGKRGVVTWAPSGGTQLWFQDESSQMMISYHTKCYSRPSSIQVPVISVQRTRLPQTIKFTKEKGYDLKPGDVVRVVRGPEYQMKGTVQSVNFPKARLILLSESDHSLVSGIQLDSVISDLEQVDVPIAFVMKIFNASLLDSFNKVIGQEVFIVGGARKGFRATLYSIGGEN